MGEFIRRPSTGTIRAIQFDGTNLVEIREFFDTEEIYETWASNDTNHIYIKTIQGERVRVSAGEWILPEKDDPNRFYPCDNEVFHNLYMVAPNREEGGSK